MMNHYKLSLITKCMTVDNSKIRRRSVLVRNTKSWNEFEFVFLKVKFSFPVSIGFMQKNHVLSMRSKKDLETISFEKRKNSDIIRLILQMHYVVDIVGMRNGPKSNLQRKYLKEYCTNGGSRASVSRKLLKLLWIYCAHKVHSHYWTNTYNSFFR